MDLRRLFEEERASVHDVVPREAGRVRPSRTIRIANSTCQRSYPSPMKRLLLLLALALTAACSAEQTPPAPPVLELPNDPPLVVRPNPVPVSMPADCFMYADFVLDASLGLSVPTTRADAEQRTNPVGNLPAPDAVVLGRLTMKMRDRYGDPVQSRPVWVVYRIGPPSKLPSGGGFNPGAPPTARPVYVSTASVTVLDALNGEHLWATGCGIKELE